MLKNIAFLLGIALLGIPAQGATDGALAIRKQVECQFQSENNPGQNIQHGVPQELKTCVVSGEICKPRDYGGNFCWSFLDVTCDNRSLYEGNATYHEKNGSAFLINMAYTSADPQISLKLAEQGEGKIQSQLRVNELKLDGVCTVIQISLSGGHDG